MKSVKLSKTKNKNIPKDPNDINVILAYRINRRAVLYAKFATIIPPSTMRQLIMSS